MPSVLSLSKSQILAINRKIRVNHYAGCVFLIVLLHAFAAIPLIAPLVFLDYAIAVPLTLMGYLGFLAWIVSRFGRYRCHYVETDEVVEIEGRFSFVVRYARHAHRVYSFGPYPIHPANKPDNWCRLSKNPLTVGALYRVKAIRIPEGDTGDYVYYFLDDTFERVGV